MQAIITRQILGALKAISKNSTALENEPTINIITLEGHHGAGKDLYAKILQKLHPYSIIARFSDPVREDFRIAGIAPNSLDVMKRTNLKFPEGTIIGSYDVSNMTTREALIHIAETNKKVHGQYYYANILTATIRENLRTITYNFQETSEILGQELQPVLNVIIPDLRFVPEIEMLQELELNGLQLGGKCHKIKRCNILVQTKEIDPTELIGYDLVLPSLTVLDIS